MNHAKESNGIRESTAVVDSEPELIVMCKHCNKPIDKVNLIGFSLICPLCGKPQNGHPELVATSEKSGASVTIPAIIPRLSMCRSPAQKKPC